MKVANHTQNHTPLGGLPREKQKKEIEEAQHKLDEILGPAPRYFAYPYGKYDESTLKVLGEMGYRLAFTSEAGWVHVGDHPYKLRRIWMGNGVDLERFKERLTTENYTKL